MPLYIVGLEGMTRRMQHYDVPEWRPWMIIAGDRRVLIALAGVVCQIVKLYVSIRDRERLRDPIGDPWDGRSLEWATASPPPAFNFAVLPQVDRRTSLIGTRKQRRREREALVPSRTTRTSRCRATARPASSAPSSRP